MEDLVFVAATVGFFVVAAGYVRFCDRVIGPDVVPRTAPPATEQERARS